MLDIPGHLRLYSSQICLTAKNCLTAHASINFGATTIQNIIFNRFHRAFYLFGGSTFGWTEVHAQMMTVDMQLQTMSNNVHFNCSEDVKP